MKELIDLKDGSPTISFLKSVGKKLGWRPIDIQNAITSPRKIAYLEETLTKIEQGDLSIRTRVLDSEKEFNRLKIITSNQASLITAGLFLNVAVVLASATPVGKAYNTLTKSVFGLAGLFGIQVPIGILKLYSYDKKLASLQDTA